MCHNLLFLSFIHHRFEKKTKKVTIKIHLSVLCIFANYKETIMIIKWDKNGTGLAMTHTAVTFRS